ncbi:MAG TPA: helix-turn-helix transcriptional regulator [Polyangiaceae bacterium]|nr:helix-turn-helix transcriptional regulator [Polyangiaceae bacterium]
MLRAWRTSRGKSQLALAVEAGISTRHLSFMENGRSTPSREMILTLAEHLDLPLRDRNSLLEAAGYAAVFRETPLEADAMTEVRAALSHILAASEPNPALVVNRRYDVLLTNSAALELFSFFAPSWTGKNNVAYLLLADDGLKPAVADWPSAAAHLVRRLRAELSGATDARDQELLALIDLVQPQLGDAMGHAPNSPGADILVPITLRRAGLSVDLFTTITTLGTPLDITLQELRIETFFPATPQSRHALARILNTSREA